MHPEPRPGPPRRNGARRVPAGDAPAAGPSTPVPLRLLRRAVLLLLAASVVGLFVVGDGSAPRPSFVPAGQVVAARGFGGFPEVGFTVAPAGLVTPPTRALCAVLASTPSTRSLGLMGRGGFGAYSAMLFTFPTPTTAAFYMAHVEFPVTLVWFDSVGRYLGQVDMIPCPGGTHCPYYYAPAPFSSAVEIPLGGAAGLGIGPGSSVQMIGPCIG